MGTTTKRQSPKPKPSNVCYLQGRTRCYATYRSSQPHRVDLKSYYQLTSKAINSCGVAGRLTATCLRLPLTNHPSYASYQLSNCLTV
eukprot:2860228-Pyramimonas_sp.AAC.1